MAGSPMEFSLAPNINPMSGTGSDMHSTDFATPFGDIIIGENESPIMKIGKDIAVGIAVLLAVQFIRKEFV